MTLVDQIAQQIRIMDGDNRLPAYELGGEIADFLWTRSLIDVSEHDDVVLFVDRTNPDKRTGAGALAELIVAEFDLGEE